MSLNLEIFFGCEYFLVTFLAFGCCRTQSLHAEAFKILTYIFSPTHCASELSEGSLNFCSKNEFFSED